MGNSPVGLFPTSLSTALAVNCDRRLLHRIHRLAKPNSSALFLFKADDWHHTLFFPTLDTGIPVLHKEDSHAGYLLSPCPSRNFSSSYAHALSVSVLEAFEATSPVDVVISVGIRSFYTSGNPDSPD